jgi:hypothetical protein
MFLSGLAGRAVGAQHGEDTTPDYDTPHRLPSLVVLRDDRPSHRPGHAVEDAAFFSLCSL